MWSIGRGWRDVPEWSCSTKTAWPLTSRVLGPPRARGNRWSQGTLSSCLFRHTKTKGVLATNTTFHHASKTGISAEGCLGTVTTWVGPVWWCFRGGQGSPACSGFVLGMCSTIHETGGLWGSFRLFQPQYINWTCDTSITIYFFYKKELLSILPIHFLLFIQ